MKRSTRQKLIEQFKKRLYPSKPWINPADLYGKKRHQYRAAFTSGEIGTVNGFSVVVVEETNE